MENVAFQGAPDVAWSTTRRRAVPFTIAAGLPPRRRLRRSRLSPRRNPPRGREGLEVGSGFLQQPQRPRPAPLRGRRGGREGRKPPAGAEPAEKAPDAGAGRGPAVG